MSCVFNVVGKVMHRNVRHGVSAQETEKKVENTMHSSVALCRLYTSTCSDLVKERLKMI